MILVAGLSPAWQQIMTFAGVTPGAVNRAQAVHWCASGKVLNVGIALSQLRGAGSTAPLTLSTIGGWSGAAIKAQFAEMHLNADWVDVPTPSRVCTTILDRAQTTELVENAAAIPAEAVTTFCHKFRRHAAKADFIVLTGSLPFGLPATFYAELLQGASAPCLLDFRGPELLACLPHVPFVVKPNREELAATVGHALPDDDAILNAMQSLNARGAVWVVVSNGPDKVHVSGPTWTGVVTPHPVARVVNPIGCGDCLAAGLAYGLTRGDDFESALQLGLRAAADNVQELLPARCRPA